MTATHPSARASVLRSALLFTPVLAVTVGALSFLVQDVARDGITGGRIIGMTLVSAVSLLLAYQVVQSVRDLFAQPVETTGLVERRWSRNEFLLFRNTYVFVKRNVFRLSPEHELDVQLGDIVRVLHYPHTSTVERIEVVDDNAQGELTNG